MEVTDVEQKLRTKEYIAVACDTRGAVWKKFNRIVKSESRVNIDWVQCKVCFKVYRYHPSRGTGYLGRHKCHGLSVKSSEVSEVVSVSKEDKDIILKACVHYCAKNLRSFSNISGDGFKHFLRPVINVSEKYDSVSMDNILPHPTTVSRHIIQEATDLRNKILPDLLKAVQSGKCAATMDFWTDDHTKINYYTVTLQYMDEMWNLVQRVLFTTDFPEEKESAVNIRSELLRRFKDFGIPQDMIQNITFVTDQGSNIVKALENYRRLNCTAHFIQCSLRNAFKYHVQLDEHGRIFETLETCKNVVTYLKRSGYVTRLSKFVHQDNDTQWSSKIKMLRSVVSQYDDIVRVLTDVKEIHRLHKYDPEAAKTLLEFLCPFEEATTELQADKSPTLHLVLLWICKLITHCQREEHDSVEMKYIKRQIEEYLKQKFVADKFHKIATFLFPPCRKLKMLPESEKAEVIQDVKNLISEGRNREEAASSTSSESKRYKINFQEWVEFDDSTASFNELKIYMTTSYVPEDELFEWWRKKKELLPKLYNLAIKVFGIPATSTASERNFGAAGFIAQKRRSRLKPEIIDGILFLHSNL